MATVAKAIMKYTRILLICHKINENRGFMCTIVIKQKGHVRFKYTFDVLSLKCKIEAQKNRWWMLLSAKSCQHAVNIALT